MQIIGSILIILAIADFGLSWLGINLTPFLPDAISRFSPIILGGLGYFFLNFCALVPQAEPPFWPGHLTFPAKV